MRYMPKYMILVNITLAVWIHTRIRVNQASCEPTKRDYTAFQNCFRGIFFRNTIHGKTCTIHENSVVLAWIHEKYAGGKPEIFPPYFVQSKKNYAIQPCTIQCIIRLFSNFHFASNTLMKFNIHNTCSIWTSKQGRSEFIKRKFREDTRKICPGATVLLYLYDHEKHGLLFGA